MIEIPGRRRLCWDHLVCDYNGTLALDGDLLVEVRETLHALAARVQVYVITADNFGLARLVQTLYVSD